MTNDQMTWRVQGDAERQRALGAIATPSDLVNFMVSLAAPSRPRARVLEPA